VQSRIIVFVVPSLGAGGAERIVTNLANAWVRPETDITIVTLLDDKKPFYSLDPMVKVQPVANLPKITNQFVHILGGLGTISPLRRLLKKIKPDIIFGFLPQVNVLTVLASLGLDAKLILSERNNIRMRKIPMKWQILRWATYRHSDIVTINNEINRQYLGSIVPEEKIIYVPNPLVFPGEDLKQEVQTRRKILLAVGRLTEQKGFDLLLKAYARTKARHHGWIIKIVGEGPERETLEKIIDHKKLQEVVTLNPPELDLSSYFNSATVFVLPSRYEGTPNALLEAIGYGLIPIVSDNLGTISEQIANVDQNLLFENGSIANLAKCIDNIVDRLAYDQYNLRGLDSVLEPYKQTNALKYWDRLITS